MTDDLVDFDGKGVEFLGFRAWPNVQIETPRYYARTRARLIEDPIVQAMAQEMIDDLGAAEALERVTGDAHIPFGFISAALTEYGNRGGIRTGHTAGVAEAMVAIIRSAAEKQTQPDQPRCPDCRVLVTDHESYFGVHLADCGYWDERCHRCHKLIPAGTASPHRSDQCRACAEPTLAVDAGEQA